MSGCTRTETFVLCLLFVFRVKTVTSQLRVQALTGDDVLLPCVFSEGDSLPATASVFWRDKDDNIVLDIKRKVPDFSTQHQKFRGRIISERELYRKGNFSIVMKNVSLSDSGPYECHIPTVNFERTVWLAVSGKGRVEVTAPPAGRSGGSAAVTAASLHTLLPLLLLLSLTCSGFTHTVSELLHTHFTPSAFIS